MASEIIVNTIKAPTTGANANKVIIPSGVTLDASGGGLTTPAGHIIQVGGGGVFSDHTNSSTSTWADTNMSDSITPISSSNKILVSFTAIIRADFTGTIARGAVRIKRTIDGTDTTLLNPDTFYEHFQMRGVSTEFSMTPSFEFLDSPATTSQVTYTVQSYIRNDSGATTIFTRGSSRGSCMTLKEVTA